MNLETRRDLIRWLESAPWWKELPYIRIVDEARFVLDNLINCEALSDVDDLAVGLAGALDRYEEQGE